MLKAMLIAAILSSSFITVGKGEISWLFWTAYEAELSAPEGKYNPAKPFALELTYKMDFTGEEIAERSVEEVRKQESATEEELAKWGTRMREIFPDVVEGDKIKGLKTEDNKSVFFHNGENIGQIDDPKFTKAFFDIWLSEKTTEPELREALLAGQ